MAADQPIQDVESALTVLEQNDDQTGFLHAVAAGEMLLPQVQEAAEDEGVQLPFVEQDGTRYVPVFSTQQRLTESGFEIHGTVTINGGQLGAAWPEEEELWLAINPGSERSVAVPPDAVRALPTLASSG